MISVKPAAYVVLAVSSVVLFVGATTTFDFGTQIRGVPIFSDAVAAGTTLAQLCAKVGTGTLSITKAWTALTTQTISCTLAFNGGSLQPGSGQTVTLLPTTQCPMAQKCFDVSLGGLIVFSSSAITTSHVNFGSDPTGVTDSHLAIQAALSSGAGTVTAPCGTYFLSASQILISRGVNVDLKCAAMTSTTSGISVLIADPYRQKVSLTLARTSIGWTSTDTTSNGIKITGVTGAQENIFDFTVSNFQTCVLLTNASQDITDNLFEHVETQDCKIAWDHRPSGGAGVNNNVFTKFSSRINSGATCPGGSPISGTKYIYLESGSDNENTWITPELEGQCIERSIDSSGSSNHFLHARFEANIANAITVAGHFNTFYDPFISAGTWSSIFNSSNPKDNGLFSSVFIGSQTDSTTTSYLSTSPHDRLYCNGTICSDIASDGGHYASQINVDSIGGVVCPPNSIGSSNACIAGNSTVHGASTVTGEIATVSDMKAPLFKYTGSAPTITAGTATLLTGSTAFAGRIASGAVQASITLTLPNVAPNDGSCMVQVEDNTGIVVRANGYPGVVITAYVPGGSTADIQIGDHIRYVCGNF